MKCVMDRSELDAMKMIFQIPEKILLIRACVRCTFWEQSRSNATNLNKI